MLSDIINRVCDDVGLNRSNAPIVQQSDRQTLQLRALLLASGNQLMRDWDWQALLRTATITTASGTPTYALPTDYNRMVDETQWLTTSKVPLFGPLNQRDFAQNQYGLVNVGPYFRFQIQQDLVNLQPTPSAVQTINYYYISAFWIKQAGVTPAATFSTTVDTDTFYLDEDLLFLNLRWRWLRAKRMAYDEERSEFDEFFYTSRSDDRGSRSLSLDPLDEVQGMQTGFIVPITGFG